MPKLAKSPKLAPIICGKVQNPVEMNLKIPRDVRVSTAFSSNTPLNIRGGSQNNHFYPKIGAEESVEAS